MTPRIQYVTTPDGVRIGYATFGEGDGVPLVVLRPRRCGFVCGWYSALYVCSVCLVQKVATRWMTQNIATLPMT